MTDTRQERPSPSYEQEYDTVDRVTMPLLQRITVQALDEDYAHAARRRQEQAALSGDEAVSARGASWWLWLAVTVVVGILLAVAGRQTSQAAVDNQSSRSALIARIDAERESLAETQARVGRVQASLNDVQSESDRVGEQQVTVGEVVRRLRTRTGYVAVTGPGVRVTVQDPPGVDPGEAIRDSDLALLVNGLWTAGAEAVAINNQRITALTYIKNSSQAINVNSRPLVPPYVVEAIGDPRTLQARLVESPSGGRFDEFARALDWEVTRQNVDDLRLPQAPLRVLRAATKGLAGNEPRPDQEGGTT
jgi:uncharacterized protein YlxW (UPF0749 family)